MISETYFLEQCLHNNLMVGGCVRVNQNNGRYAWHRITNIYHWMINKKVFRTTIITVEIDHDWTDGDHHVWPDKKLIERMLLTTIPDNIMDLLALKFKVATHWEHDVLEPFVEQYHIHLN